MAHILITGSADGLGRAAAETLLGDGHQVIVHTRSAGRWPPSNRSSAEARQPSSETWRTSTKRGHSLTK
jgi:NAD(P)-dependent dehydrogenase (short-subunit alcohol dehydrogenase family)